METTKKYTNLLNNGFIPFIIKQDGYSIEKISLSQAIILSAFAKWLDENKTATQTHEEGLQEQLKIMFLEKELKISKLEKDIEEMSGLLAESLMLNTISSVIFEMLDEISKDHEWISVKDKLPEKDKNVLAYDARSRRFRVCYLDLVEEDNGELVHFWADDEYYDLAVTHWMPLPDEPEKMEE